MTFHGETQALEAACICPVQPGLRSLRALASWHSQGLASVRFGQLSH